MKLTVNQALEIQAKHIKHYGPRFPGGEEALRAVVESRTKIPADLDREDPVSIIDINKMVPRGGDIEFIVWKASAYTALNSQNGKKMIDFKSQMYRCRVDLHRYVDPKEEGEPDDQD